jgi:endonuclease-3
VKPDPSHLPAQLERLEELHGAPRRPLPRTALDWVLWENAAYLVPDERRRAAYRALAKRTGLRAQGIVGLAREELHAIAALGGMMPERRVEKLLAIAETMREAFDGDLEPALALPLAQARRALKGFPGIGAPGADKILLFTRTHALPALDSNGLRVLVRLGHAKEAKSYAATYRDALRALAPMPGGAARGCTWLIPPGWLGAHRRAPRMPAAHGGCAAGVRAYELLRTHGQALCKHNDPH